MSARWSRPDSRVSVCVIVFVLLSLGVRHADAWGNEGHRIICQIALERLTPAGKMLVDAIRADIADVEDPFDNCPDCQKTHKDDRLWRPRFPSPKTSAERFAHTSTFWAGNCSDSRAAVRTGSRETMRAWLRGKARSISMIESSASFTKNRVR